MDGADGVGRRCERVAQEGAEDGGSWWLGVWVMVKGRE